MFQSENIYLKIISKQERVKEDEVSALFLSDVGIYKETRHEHVVY